MMKTAASKDNNGVDWTYVTFAWVIMAIGALIWYGMHRYFDYEMHQPWCKVKCGSHRVLLCEELEDKISWSKPRQVVICATDDRAIRTVLKEE